MGINTASLDNRRQHATTRDNAAALIEQRVQAFQRDYILKIPL